MRNIVLVKKYNANTTKNNEMVKKFVQKHKNNAT